MTKKELIQLINEVIDEISINKGFESHDDDDLCKVSYVDRSQVLDIIKQNNNFYGVDSTDLDLIKSFNYTNAYCKNSFGKTKMIEFYRNKNKDDAIVLVSLDDGKNWHVTSGGDSKSKLNEVDKPAYYNFYGIEKIKKIIKNNNNFNGVNNILDIIEKKNLYYSTGVQPIGFIKNTKVIEFSKTTQGPPELTLVTSDNGRTWKITTSDDIKSLKKENTSTNENDFGSFQRYLTGPPVNHSAKIISDNSLAEKVKNMWDDILKDSKGNEYVLKVTKESFRDLFDNRPTLLGSTTKYTDIYYQFRILGYLNFFPKNDIRSENFNIKFVKDNRETIKKMDDRKLNELIKKIGSFILQQK